MSSTKIVEGTLTTPAGFKLAFKRFHPGARHRAIGLHGWQDSAATFNRLAPLLPDVDLCALDFAGHGFSQRRETGVYHFIDYAVDVVHALYALEWETCSLIGHSMGAGVSALVAGTIPQKITRLCAIEGLGALTQKPEDTPSSLEHSIADEIRKRKRTTKRVFKHREDAVSARVRAGPIDPSSAEVLASRGLAEVDGGFRWRADPMLRMASRQRLTDEQILAFLRRISCPTLVIRASEGFPIPESHWQRRLAEVQHLELQTLPGRHHLHLDDPAPVAAQVARFFASGDPT